MRPVLSVHTCGGLQVTVHAEVQLQARRLFEGLLEWVVQKPIYLVDFATFDVPAECASCHASC